MERKQLEVEKVEELEEWETLSTCLSVLRIGRVRAVVESTLKDVAMAVQMSCTGGNGSKTFFTNFHKVAVISFFDFSAKRKIGDR